jgi:hypothetical protein
MRTGTSREVGHRDDWVKLMGARREEEWAPPVRLRRWGSSWSPGQTPARPPALARWRGPLAGLVRPRRKVRLARLIDRRVRELGAACGPRWLRRQFELASLHSERCRAVGPKVPCRSAVATRWRSGAVLGGPVGRGWPSSASTSRYSVRFAGRAWLRYHGTGAMVLVRPGPDGCQEQDRRRVAMSESQCPDRVHPAPE